MVTLFWDTLYNETEGLHQKNFRRYTCEVLIKYFGL
jgi:hypothetical protein